MNTELCRRHVLNGIEFGVKTFTLGRVMLVNPENIQAEHAEECALAKFSGVDYLTAIDRYKLDKDRQVELGFIGGRYCKTEELTPIWCEQLRSFQESQRKKKAA